MIVALVTVSVFAGAQDEDLRRLHGQLSDYNGKPGPPGFYNDKQIAPAAAQTLKQTLSSICSQLENTEPLNTLAGFNLRRRIDIGTPNTYNIPADKAYTGSAWAAMFHFIRSMGKVIQYPETPAGIMVDINQLYQLAPQEQLMGEGSAECRLPYFFLASYLKFTQNPGGYYEMTDRDQYTRIYTNGKPLFIPYTSAQLLTFYIKYYQLQASKLNDNISSTVKQIEDNKRIPGEITESANKALSESLSTFRQQLAGYSNLAAQYTAQMNSLSPQAAGAPAYIDMNQTDAGGLMRPAIADGDGIQAVLTINPSYFNTALPKTGIQLITIKFYGLDRSSDFFLSKLLAGAYDHFDFEKLKELVKK